jgi:hypothetical protein
MRGGEGHVVTATVKLEYRPAGILAAADEFLTNRQNQIA